MEIFTCNAIFEKYSMHSNIFKSNRLFEAHSGSNCDRSSSIVKGLEGPMKTRVPVITWQDHHYVSTPIRSEQGGERERVGGWEWPAAPERGKEDRESSCGALDHASEGSIARVSWLTMLIITGRGGRIPGEPFAPICCCAITCSLCWRAWESNGHFDPNNPFFKCLINHNLTFRNRYLYKI